MKDILLNQDDSINVEAIDNYLESYDINAPYNNPDSIYHQQTPLAIVVGSNEINPETKVRLAAYLFEMGVKIKISDELLAMAFSESNLELASLLLKKGADVDSIWQRKNLLEIAFDSQNNNAMLWVMKNANELFLSLSRIEFKKYSDEIREISGDKNDELHQAFQDIKKLYNNFGKRMILGRFDKLGHIKMDEVALVLAAKMSDKSRENSTFVISSEDTSKITDEIKKFLENDTNENQLKFQIIHFSVVHAVYGEFLVDKNSNPPVISYFHCDPLPPVTPYYDVLTKDFVNTISPLADIVIYDSDVTLQKGLGCSYFSLDGARMLATPSERDYAVDVMEHMRAHGEIKESIYSVTNVKYMQSDSLPARYLRGLQLFDDGKEAYQKGIKTLIFNTNEKNTIVNKKSETAEKSIRKDLKEQQKKYSPNESVVYNLRTERKMKQYQKTVDAFIKDKNILDPEFDKTLDKFKISGLEKFVENKLTPKTKLKL